MKLLQTILLAMALGILTGCNNPAPPPAPSPIPAPKPTPTPVPTPPPPAPVPLPTKRTVTLIWDAVSNATDYLIERDDLLVGTATRGMFTDAGVAPGVYTYSVSGRNPAGVGPVANITVTV